MQHIYHATPYDLSATGFYFSTYSEYAARSVAHRNEYGDPVEEYEIQLIDGDNYKLFDVLSVNQANLKAWFNDFESLAGEDLIKAIYLADELGILIDDVLSQLDDVALFEGSALDYAHNYIEETGLLSEIPENLQFYFDTEAFARDMLLGGGITEMSINGTDYIVWGC